MKLIEDPESGEAKQLWMRDLSFAVNPEARSRRMGIEAVEVVDAEIMMRVDWKALRG